MTSNHINKGSCGCQSTEGCNTIDNYFKIRHKHTLILKCKDMNDLQCSKISFNIISIKPINHEQRQTKTTRRCERFTGRNHLILKRHQGRRTGCLRQHARKPPVIRQRLPHDRCHRYYLTKLSLPSRRRSSTSTKLPHKNNKAACTGSFVRTIILYLHEPLKATL